MKTFTKLFVFAIILATSFGLDITDQIATNVTPKNELVTIGSKTYFIGFAPELTFSEAMTTCHDMEMTLVSLETQEKHNEIYLFLYTYYSSSRNYWTSGMRYMGNTNNWIWSSRGQHITWFEWANNQPNKEEQCILLNVHSVDGWHDAKCEEDRSAYICEFPCAV